MPEMNGGQALIQALQREGVRTVFGIPGAGQYQAVDALYGAEGIRYISVRHEQATTYMADGYARASGEIAAAIVVQGPGIFNALAGMGTAYAVSSPMLVVTGTRHQIGQDDPDLHWARPVTKWAGRAQSPAAIPGLVQEAFRQMRSGRPRPVALEIAPKVFAAREEVQLLEPATVSPLHLDQAQLEEAARLLVHARRPVLWAGGGLQRAGAAEALLQLAEYLQLPVVTSRQGKGVFDDRHPLALGMAELRYAPLRHWLAERDCILAAGTSAPLSDFTMPVIRMDADVSQFAARNKAPQLEGDALTMLDALQAAAAEITPPRSTNHALHAEIRALNAQRYDPAQQLQPQWDLMQAIRRGLPDDGILVQGMNQMGYYSRNYFPVYASRGYLTASALATLGCAWPLALGAKLAQPDRAVVALCGDGGFLYNSQELATAIRYGINAVAIVFNDSAYGNVLRAQEEEFDGRVIGTQLHNPNFVKLAEAYGVRGVRVQSHRDLANALQAALAADQPALIEVPVSKMERVY